jgi:hypothetical protein
MLNNNNNNNTKIIREITANRSDIMIKNKKEKACTLIDVAIPADRNVVQKEAEKKLKYRCGNTCRQKRRAKVSGKEVKIQEFRCRDKTNVELEMYDYTSYNWSHWNSNEKLKEKSGSYTRKTFDKFTTEDSYTCNITHNTESTAV